jgi:hypothetical protein
MTDPQNETEWMELRPGLERGPADSRTAHSPYECPAQRDVRGVYFTLGVVGADANKPST